MTIFKKTAYAILLCSGALASSVAFADAQSNQLTECIGGTITVENSTGASLAVNANFDPSDNITGAPMGNFTMSNGQTSTWTIVGGKNDNAETVNGTFTFGDSSDNAGSTASFQGMSNGCNLNMSNTNTSTTVINKSKSGHDMYFNVCTANNGIDKASNCSTVN